SHTWKVLAKNNAGAVTSPTWGFSAAVGPPAAPVSPTPANNAMLTVQPTKLDWADSLGAENYDVYVGTNPTPVRVTASEINVAPADGVRLWRVVANNVNGS